MKFLVICELEYDFIKSLEQEDEGPFDPEVLKKGWYYVLERDFVPPIGDDLYRLHFDVESGGVSFGPRAIWDYPDPSWGKAQVHIFMELVEVDGGLPALCEVLTKYCIDDFDKAVSSL